MAGHDYGTRLDEESRKRLHKLQAEWDKGVGAFFIERLTMADLRLLLEHFPPLQVLIRAIAVGENATAGEMEDDQANEAGQAAQPVVYVPPREMERSLRDELARCETQLQKLLQDNRKLEQVCRQLKDELAAARRSRAAAAPVELILLREDASLAAAMGLAALPEDDLQAWTQVVAVLAQRDSLERLWSVIKMRCEGECRPANEGELRLLSSALTWFNHNWRARPYQLREVAPSTAFDFDTQQRSSQAAAGDTVAELWLPGIADGGGRLLCKPLVLTR